MRLIGIDPSLTKTGLALVEADGFSCRLLAVRSILAGLPSMPLVERLLILGSGIEDALIELGHGAPAPVGVVCEDPTDQSQIGPRRSPTTIAKLGAAAGVVLYVARDAALGANVPFQAIPAGMWIPKEGGRPVKHELHIRTLRALLTGAAAANDDELMAAGVAWYYARDQARPPMLRANYAHPVRKRGPLPPRGAS